MFGYSRRAPLVVQIFRTPGVDLGTRVYSPAAWFCQDRSRALLRFLPSRGQGQTRASCLPHRATPAHRSRSRRPRKATARRILSVLWRADEKAAAPAAPMEPRPGTAATQETLLCMIAASFTTPMSTGFFPFKGNGDGALRSSRENRRGFLMIYTLPPDSTPGNRADLLATEASRLHPTGHQPAKPALPPERLPTQNA